MHTVHSLIASLSLSPSLSGIYLLVLQISAVRPLLKTVYTFRWEGIGIVSEILNGEAIIVSGDRKEVIPASLGGWTRRLLIGLGSSPPRCAAKCGKCTPCRPVHVPVPPGTPVTAEYYPEAWRCKCGNKLYMP
ncbi:EPIDERMAL PATTERNING FACTOR-like protein 6 isoform X3 [Diospyros lotus]|uniref:EPIDERMAL PATTERNING FACTOR-like protein 6 isoform X3 n=1 Tax=Diospyros lotus TaxID=55363 RepID=UPI002258CAF0|nr:EPIDERMAL PATTERNING FACTOR-like protein 6 isoform X3 [Diospyros lotus]